MKNIFTAIGKSIKKLFSQNRNKVVVSLLAFILCVTMAISGVTMAILIKEAGSLENTFKPATLGCNTIMTPSSGAVTNVQVESTSDTKVYAKVTLIAYYENADGQVQGEIAPTITFTLNSTDWLDGTNGTYFYKVPLDVNATTRNLIKSGTITLTAPQGAHTDGLIPVVKAYGEVIQAQPANAVTGSWGVTVQNGQITGATNTRANYKVEYYQETSADTYTLIETQTKQNAIVGTAVRADDKTIATYELDLTNSESKPIGTVLPDGSLVLKMYYRKIRYKVTINLDSVDLTFNGKTYDAYTFTNEDLAKMDVATEGGIDFFIEDGKFVAYDVWPSNDITYSFTLSYNGKSYGKQTFKVIDADVERTVENVTKTNLWKTGSGHTTLDGYTSFIRTKSKRYLAVDSLAVDYYDYTYQHETKGTRYYVETDIDITVADLENYGGFVGLMVAHDIAPLDSGDNGNNKLIVGITRDNKLVYYAGDTWGWLNEEKTAPIYTVIADVSEQVGTNTTSYELGVLRNGSEYSVFVNDIYVATFTEEKFKESGFGVGSLSQDESGEVNGTVYNSTNANQWIAKFSNYMYSFNEDFLGAIEEEILPTQYNVTFNVHSGYMVFGNNKYYLHNLTDTNEAGNIYGDNVTLEIKDEQGERLELFEGVKSNVSMTLPAGKYTAVTTFTSFTNTYNAPGATASKASTVKTTSFTVNSNKTVDVETSITDIGGSFKIGNSTYNSVLNNNGNGYRISNATADTLKGYNAGIANIHQVTGSSYYIEGIFPVQTNWYPDFGAFYMNSAGTNPWGGKLIYFGSKSHHDGVRIYYIENDWQLWANPSSYKNDGTTAVTPGTNMQIYNKDNPIKVTGNTYKFGVLRENDWYYVFVNGRFIFKKQITSINASSVSQSANNVSGFGYVRGGDGGHTPTSGTDNDYQEVKDIKWTKNTDIITALKSVANSELVTVHEVKDDILLKNGNIILDEGDTVAKGTSLTITVNVPTNQVLNTVTATIDGVVQTLTKTAENVYTFAPSKSGNLVILADYDMADEIKDRTTYSVNILLDTGHIMLNGKKYYFHDIADYRDRLSLVIKNESGEVVHMFENVSNDMAVYLTAGKYTAVATFDAEGAGVDTVDSQTFTVSSDMQMNMETSFTDVGGSFTLNDTTINSRRTGANSATMFSNPSADSIIGNNSSTAYIHQETGSTYYIEGIFPVQNISYPAYAGFIVNTCGGNPFGNPASNTIMFGVKSHYDGVSVYYNKSVSRWWATSSADANPYNNYTPVSSVAYKVKISNDTFRFGVLRNNDYYYVFIDGVCVFSEQITAKDTSGTTLSAENLSGFGAFRGGDGPNSPITITDIEWTTDADIISELLSKGNNKVTVRDVHTKVAVKSGNTALSQGAQVNVGTTLNLVVTVPANEILSSLSVKVGNKQQTLTKSATNTYTFTPLNNGDLTVVAEFEKVETAMLRLSYRSAYVVKDGIEYDMYDISDVGPNDVSVTLTNVYTGQVTQFTFNKEVETKEVAIGVYDIKYTYKFSDKETTQMTERVEVLTNTQFAGQISKSFLGGDVTYEKETGGTVTINAYGEYRNTTPAVVAANNWSLMETDGSNAYDDYHNNSDKTIDGIVVRNAVKIMRDSYVMQKEVVTDAVYIEAKVDTATNYAGVSGSAGQGFPFAGLLVAHARDNLDDVQTNSYKLFIGLQKDEVVVVPTGTGWTTNYAVKIANLRDKGLLDNSSVVKIGVARKGTYFYVYANDIYVGSYQWTEPLGNRTSGIGIGSVGSPNSIITDFNYSVNADLVGAFTKRSIDVYLIAGQSNGAGFTKYNSTTNPLTLTANMTNGYENIYYAGSALNPSNGSTTYTGKTVSFASGMTKVKVGQGAGDAYIGPELGMADALSAYYNVNSGKEAAIIKYAVGGTNLLDNLGGQNTALGNWVPPTYKQQITPQGNKTGALFTNFISTVQNEINNLKAQGYDEINVKGLYWMQGENDRTTPTEYKKVFKLFVTDVRSYLTTATGQNCSSLPIIVGEISDTFYAATTWDYNTNIAFNEMLNLLPAEIPNVIVAKNGGYEINKLDGNGANVTVGTDRYHWAGQDAFNVGKGIGYIILDKMV